MEKSIDIRFERLEKALANLIDSVTKYHPSILQAEELKAADDDLSIGLLEVQTHQNNYLRIQQLRRLSATLDAQIRDTLISLATTRKDIITIQTTSYPPGDNYPVTYTQLLQYARRISKTTMPPAATLGAAAAAAAATNPAITSTTASPHPTSSSTSAPSGGPDTQMGGSGDAGPTPGSLNNAAANGLAQQATPAQPTPGPLDKNTDLPDGMSQYLNPLSGQVFFPWPLEDKIRSGALASIQILAEQGIDPQGFDPVAEEDRKRREEEERRQREEHEKLERAEKERSMREEMERIRLERERQREKEQAEWRRASVVGGSADAPAAAAAATRGGPAAGEKKKQFQFTNLDDLDDDDDDDED